MRIDREPSIVLPKQEKLFRRAKRDLDIYRKSLNKSTRGQEDMLAELDRMMEGGYNGALVVRRVDVVKEEKGPKVSFTSTYAELVSPRAGPSSRRLILATDTPGSIPETSFQDYNDDPVGLIRVLDRRHLTPSLRVATVLPMQQGANRDSTAAHDRYDAGIRYRCKEILPRTPPPRDKMRIERIGHVGGQYHNLSGRPSISMGTFVDLRGDLIEGTREVGEAIKAKAEQRR